MQIRPLRTEDIPRALELSTQAGWNQIHADWQRLLDLAPDGSIAGWVDDELVATATLLTYGDSAGWIGMVLVEEDHRRQGFGMEIFERTLEMGIERGLSEIGLDATAAGRAVYEQVGFVDVAPIERWSGTVAAAAQYSTRSVTRGPSLSKVFALDRAACHVDRSALISHLAEEADTQVLLVSDSATGEDRGFAIVRPGREFVHVGPIVAADADVLRTLLGATENLLDEPRIIIDVLDSEPMHAVLRDANLERQRTLTRMTHGEPYQTLVGDDVVAAAGFELG